LKKDKEESPYKPETTLLCVTARLRNVIALNIAPKSIDQSLATYYISKNEV